MDGLARLNLPRARAEEEPLEVCARAVERASGIAARRYALDQLERALLCADPGSVRLDRGRLEALGVSRAILDAIDVELPPHAVKVPFVFHDGTANRAIVRAVMVTADVAPLHRPGWSLGTTALLAVRSAMALAIRHAAQTTDADKLRLVPVSPGALAGVEVDGPSLAAAAYVSTLAFLSGRRVRPTYAVTGAVVGRRLGAVGSLDDKLAAARTLGLRLVAPSADVALAREGVVAVADLESLAELMLEPAPRDLDIDAEVLAAARASESGWNGYRWPAVREVVTRVLARVPATRPELHVELLARLAATERHLGRTHESFAAIASAERILRTRAAALAVPDEPRIRLLRQKAMTYRQAYRVRQALKAAAASVELARRARLRVELSFSLGAAGLCALAARRPREAVAAFEEALSLMRVLRPSQVSRSRAYLVEALGRAGELGRARRHYALALEEAESDARRGEEGKVAWVRTSFAAALRASAKHREAVDVLSDPSVVRAIAEMPLPGLLARRHLGLARLACASSAAERASALVLLEDSPFAYDGLEPGLAQTAYVNVLHAALARARSGEDVSKQVASSLRRLPSSRVLARLVARLDSMVAAQEARTPDPAAFADGLARLLAHLDPA